jgi:SprB repeat
LYTVSLTDGAGCPLVLSSEIEEPTAVTVVLSATGETSAGANNGSASALPVGGTPGYTYLWNTNATTATINNLTPGSYTVTVRDANGCSTVGSAVVTSVSCDLETEMIVTPVKCFNTASGTATILVTGATGDLTYAWSNGVTTQTVDNATEGTLTVTVTDEVGCTAVGTAMVSGPAAPLVASAIDIDDVFCPNDQNGAATPDIDGGWGAPYSYQFSWGIGGFQNLAAGDYSFTVTDAQGCSTVATFEIVVLDSVGPVMQCPDNIVLCGADLLDYPTPQATDECGREQFQLLVYGDSISDFRCGDQQHPE